MTTFEPKIVSAFEREFRACEALLDFAKAHRPKGAPTRDEAGDLILRTYARSSKTYTGALRLAALGYGEQVAMLGRSLFEDMVVAHWVGRHPDAPSKLERHRLLTVERLRQAAHRFGREDFLREMPPPLPRAERKQLEAEFAGKPHWTGKSMDELVAEIEDEWTNPIDRRLFGQVYSFGVSGSNQVLHHGHIGVVAGVEETLEKRTFNIGPSPVLVRDALSGAFFAYSNTVSLVLDPSMLDAFRNLYSEHIQTFVKITRGAS